MKLNTSLSWVEFDTVAFSLQESYTPVATSYDVWVQWIILCIFNNDFWYLTENADKNISISSLQFSRRNGCTISHLPRLAACPDCFTLLNNISWRIWNVRELLSENKKCLECAWLTVIECNNLSADYERREFLLIDNTWRWTVLMGFAFVCVKRGGGTLFTRTCYNNSHHLSFRNCYWTLRRGASMFVFLVIHLLDTRSPGYRFGRDWPIAYSQSSQNASFPTFCGAVWKTLLCTPAWLLISELQL